MDGERIEVSQTLIHDEGDRNIDQSWRTKLRRKCFIRNILIRQFIAEMFGTFILMLIGNASIAQWVLGGSRGTGNIVTVVIGFSMAVTMGVTVSAGISGGHINPSVTIMLAVIGEFPWKKVPLYILAQMIGSFISCPLLYVNIIDDLNAFDNGTRHVVGPLATSHIFATYPGPNVTIVTCVIDQLISSALLGFVILAMLDEKNEFCCSKAIFPFLVGWLIASLLTGFIGNTGCPLNPARDLPPRLFTLIAGWGIETFSMRSYGFFWIGIVVPPVGCAIGGVLYQTLFSWHWPEVENRQIHPDHTKLMPKRLSNALDNSLELEKNYFCLRQ